MEAHYERRPNTTGSTGRQEAEAQEKVKEVTEIAFSVVTLGALLWALKACPRARWLRNYLLAQTFATPVELLLWSAIGYGPVYTFCYVLLTGIVLATVVGLALDYLAEPKQATIVAAFIIASMGLIAALTGMGETIWTQQLQVATAYILSFCGIVMGLSAVGRRDNILPLSLSLLWMAQAGMHYGIVLHWDSGWWIGASRWMPGTMIAVSTLWLGWIFRHRHIEAR